MRESDGRERPSPPQGSSQRGASSARQGLNARRYAGTPAPQAATLADVLERVLDKGMVIAGDIAINLLDIELLTIKLRLLIASVDKAKEIGIDWWESDPQLSSQARRLQDENRALSERLERLERMLDSGEHEPEPLQEEVGERPDVEPRDHQSLVGEGDERG